MTTIAVVYTDQIAVELSTDMDDESIKYWARNMVEYNDHIAQIIVDFDEGRMIFERIH